MKFLIGAMITVAMMSSVAGAQSQSSGVPGFKQAAYDISTYPENFEEVDLSLEDIDSATFQKLLVNAERETWEWADTILGGDYQLTGDPVVLNAVSAIYDAQGVFVAYRIIYSQHGWDTGACEFDWDRLADAEGEELYEVLKDCQEGDIVGNSFVSPDLSKSERDYNNIEHFE